MRIERDLTTAQFGHRFLQHLLVEFETDFLDVARLFLAEKIAAAAQIEIMAGKLEACAERIKCLQHLEALVGLFGERLVGRQREERVSPKFRPANAAPQLVELGKAEHVGAVHDHRVGGRNVETRFHDGCRQQHVIFAVIEGVHDVFEFARRHLAMRHNHPQFRHMLVEKRLDVLKVGNARTHIKAVAAAITLPHQRFTDNQRVER